MDALAVGVLEPPRLERPAGGGRRARGLEQRRGRADREQRRRVQPVVDAVPDLAVGPDGRRGDRAGLRVERRERAAREVVAVEAMAAVDELEQQQRRSVGPPVDRLHRAREIQRQVDELAAPRIPEGRALLAGPLVGDGDPRVAGERREGVARQLQTLVAQLRDGLAGPGVDRPQRRVEHVAVLHDLEHDDRLVARERPAVDGARQAPAAGEANRLVVLVDLARDAAALRRPHREPLLGAQPGHRARRPDRQPLRPALGQALDQRLRRDVLVEGGDDVAAGLGAGRVVEPDHAGAVAGRPALEHADRVVGDLPPLAGRAVPRVELVAPALGRRHDEPVGCVGRPGREGEEGSPEPALPGRKVGHGPMLPRAAQRRCIAGVMRRRRRRTRAPR